MTRKFWFIEGKKSFCSSCKKKVVFELIMEPGCTGHDGDQRCYCPYPETYLEASCRGCNKVERVPGATDRYGIERTLIEAIKRGIL